MDTISVMVNDPAHLLEAVQEALEGASILYRTWLLGHVYADISQLTTNFTNINNWRHYLDINDTFNPFNLLSWTILISTSLLFSVSPPQLVLSPLPSHHRTPTTSLSILDELFLASTPHAYMFLLMCLLLHPPLYLRFHCLSIITWVYGSAVFLISFNRYFSKPLPIQKIPLN